MVRRGIAFLEPATIVLKGQQTADREAVQDADFVRSLRVRMGYVSYRTLHGIVSA
jgi:RecQ-mediated genome instability protein 1